MNKKETNLYIERGSSRRRYLKTLGLSSMVLTALPSHWVKPVINSVILPTHAMTSTLGCGPQVVEPLTDVISLFITPTEVQGPIVVDRTLMSFSGVEQTTLGVCSNGAQQNQTARFEGQIDIVLGVATGTLDVDLFCGDLLVCEQRTSFSATQVPAISGDGLGAYEGSLTGTLSCCEDSMNILQTLNGLSIIRQ